MGCGGSSRVGFERVPGLPWRDLGEVSNALREAVRQGGVAGFQTRRPE